MAWWGREEEEAERGQDGRSDQAHDQAIQYASSESKSIAPSASTAASPIDDLSLCPCEPNPRYRGVVSMALLALPLHLDGEVNLSIPYPGYQISSRLSVLAFPFRSRAGLHENLA